MSVAPMKLVTIAGPLPEFDTAVRSCIVNREFHPESAMTVMKKVKGLYPFELHNPYTGLLHRAGQLAEKTGIRPDFHEFPEELYNIEEAQDFFEQLDRQFTALLDEQAALQERIEDNKHLLIQVEHVAEVAVPLQDFFKFTYVKFRFGRMPRELYTSFYPHVVDRSDVFFFKTSQDRDFVYGMYMTPRMYAENIDSLFASLQFERLRLSDRLEGSGEEAMRMLAEDNEASAARLAAITQELETLRQASRQDFLQHYCFVRYMNDSYDLRRYAAHTGESFYIMGWVPEAEFKKFTGNIERFSALNFVVVSDEPGGLTDFVPPVKLKNPKIFRPFEPFVGMYGLPSYNELDPTPLMAITYSLLFGIMFGDLGQGVVLALVGWLMWKVGKQWMGRVLVYAGVCSAVMGGLVYGSVFGYEELGYGFHATHNSSLLLTISVYGGCGLVTLAMILNIVNGLRQRNMEKALFGPSALAGMALYWGIILVVLPFIGFGTQTLSPALLLGLSMLPLVLVFLREPLAHFAEKRGRWKTHNGKTDFILSNFFEMIETLLSYMTNTLSFLRVGAYAISHASMMGVVYSMAETVSGGHNPVVLIIGNIIVIGIEALLVGIQVLRLDFYELFGRFYSGTGRPYKPIIIDYKKLDE